MNLSLEQHWLQEAIQQASLCTPSPDRYCVGCIITTPSGELLSSGYTGEIEENWHAEQAALYKLAQSEAAKAVEGAWLFTSLEPCTTRKSCPASCSELIITAHISTVIFCAYEPTHFTTCIGQEKLTQAGIIVRQHKEFIPSVQHMNRHLSATLFSPQLSH